MVRKNEVQKSWHIEKSFYTVDTIPLVLFCLSHPTYPGLVPPIWPQMNVCNQVLLNVLSTSYWSGANSHGGAVPLWLCGPQQWSTYLSFLHNCFTYPPSAHIGRFIHSLARLWIWHRTFILWCMAKTSGRIFAQLHSRLPTSYSKKVACRCCLSASAIIYKVIWCRKHCWHQMGSISPPS